MFAKHKLRFVKFDHFLASYLYKSKKLSLQGIGTFTLEGNLLIPHEQEKEVFYPIDGLTFHYNPKIESDEALIKMLVEKLGKIQPLVRSDLESYLSNIKQFLNLGKPYTIEGIGTLSITNNGIYEFHPGNFLPVKEELNPKRENEEHNYPVQNNSNNAGKILVMILIVMAGLAALVGIGWGVTSLLSKYQQKNEVIENTQGYIDTLNDPVGMTNALPVSNNPRLDSILPVEADSLLKYKMAFQLTRFKAIAAEKAAQLQSFGTPVKVDTILIRDSIRYRLYIPMQIRKSDTTRIKDSLSLSLGMPIKIIRAKQ